MIREVDDDPKTIPGIVIDSSPVDYRIANGVLGERERQNALEIRQQVSQELFIDAIKSKWGNLSSVANELQLPRHYVEQRIKNDPELWQAYADAREMRLDLVEDQIFDNAIGGDTRAALAYMESQGRHRGWGKETKTLNVGLNVNDLSIEELSQIVNGEIPERMK